MDRYGQLDHTVQLVKGALATLNDVKLVLNADDPMVAQLGIDRRHNTHYFGVAPQGHQSSWTSGDSAGCLCPCCGAALNYSVSYYSQLGHYQCSQCCFKRQAPDTEVIDTTIGANNIQMEVGDGNDFTTVTMPTAGMYNVYNALAAFALGKVLNIDPLTIKQGLERYSPAVGRMEMFRYQDKPVMLNLVKNSTGLNEALATVLHRDDTKDIMIAVNDHAADGRDVSWLWDVNFELLATQLEGLINFTCSGTRAEEVAVRLKYAGIPLERIKVVNDPRSAVIAALQGGGGSSYFFCAYTALGSVREALCHLAEKEGDHAVGLSSVS